MEAVTTFICIKRPFINKHNFTVTFVVFIFVTVTTPIMLANPSKKYKKTFKMRHFLKITKVSDDWVGTV